jgi:hypothetical protein
MAEVLPSTAAGQMEESQEITRTSEDASLTRRLRGTREDAAWAEFVAWQNTSFSFAALPGRRFEAVSTTRSNSKGRGELEVVYRQLVETADIDGTQELYGVDVSRDIYSAPYFESLSNAAIIDVRRVFEAQGTPDDEWSQLQKRLFGHLAHGQEQYTDTYYELRWTVKTTSRQLKKVNVSDVNTVQGLPRLAPVLTNLIDTLPSGEWLYKPVQVVSIGRNGWQVVRTWQWAKTWSVIYGGTFTGEDA